MAVDWDGGQASEAPYQIAPHGVYRAELRGDALALGYARVTPEVGPTPTASAVVQLWNGDGLVTEAGMGEARETTRARISVDHSGGRQIVVALAHRGIQSVEVEFILQNRFGEEQERVSREIPPGGHLLQMAHDLFPSMVNGYNGLIEIQSPVAVIPLTLQLTGEQLIMAVLPVADLTQPQTAAMKVFSTIVIGSGFETRMVFLNGEASEVGVEFYEANGSPMTVPLAGETADQFTFDFAGNEGKRLFPGDAGTVSSISLRDSVTNAPTTEVTINEGNTVRPRILALDSTGKARDDMGFTFTSLDTTVATITGSGQITGNQRGFSTLTIQSGDTVATATITVVGIESGVSGAFGTGITQDLAGRVYLASTADYTVVRVESLSQTPEVYAGQRQRSGLKNDLRLQSEFASPAFLTLDQARGDLYISDAANHVIRTIAPGPNGRSATLAGTGTAGSLDGASDQAGFNNPQGVVLDNRGHLWVADKDNHTIRRINLVTGEVETIAGSAGQPGSADGQGSNARFNQPTGIAIESETTAQQLAREARGDPPPEIRVVVADTANGLIRRVTAAGLVETLTGGTSGSVAAVTEVAKLASDIIAGVPLNFTTPTGVSVDAFGNIHVSERTSANQQRPDGFDKWQSGPDRTAGNLREPPRPFHHRERSTVGCGDRPSCSRDPFRRARNHRHHPATDQRPGRCNGDHHGTELCSGFLGFRCRRNDCCPIRRQPDAGVCLPRSSKWTFHPDGPGSRWAYPECVAGRAGFVGSVARRLHHDDSRR